MSFRIRGINADFHSGGGLSAGSKFQCIPTAGADNRTTFCHAISNGVGETYLFEKSFYFGIERSAADNDFVEITSEDFHSCLAGQRFDFVIDDRYFEQ